MNELIPRHGGYRRLKSFQVAQLVYDVTVRFCERYVDRFSRTKDQMVQAARSGVQNIAEGSQTSATSKKTELKLTQVARASLEELKLDYEDFLRQRGFELWSLDDPRRQALVRARPQSADAFALWVREVRGMDVRGMDVRGMDDGQDGRDRQDGQNGPRNQQGASIASIRSISSILSMPPRPVQSAPPFPEIAANGAHALTGVACTLLNRQVNRLAADFTANGGFTERLYRTRTTTRRRIVR